MQWQYVPCNLCGYDEWQVRFPATLNGSGALDVDAFRCTSAGYGHHPQIVQCSHCGYVYANPRWSADTIVSAYTAVEDDVYVQERTGRELTFQKHLAALEKVTGSAGGRRLLDVGAYIGVFVEVARAAGWDASGVEPSRWAVAQAQQHGLPVCQGTQETLLEQGQRFDVLTMWDVIEHVDDPAAELQKSYQLLRPGGVIAVHTMDVESLMARLMRGRWPWLMDMHLHYFSRHTLTAMLQKQGFDVLWCGPQGRYLRLGYLATRVGGLSEGLGRLSGGVVQRLGLAEAAVPVNFGDLITAFARKPDRS